MSFAFVFFVLVLVDDEAFVTLATNDQYALGALVLCSSLKRVNTTRQTAIMVTKGISQRMRYDTTTRISHINPRTLTFFAAADASALAAYSDFFPLFCRSTKR